MIIHEILLISFMLLELAMYILLIQILKSEDSVSLNRFKCITIFMILYDAKLICQGIKIFYEW